MTRNYRVVRQSPIETSESGEWLSIREIYYDENGKIFLYSEPCGIEGETLDEMKEELSMMLRSLAHPIIDFADLPSTKE